MLILERSSGQIKLIFEPDDSISPWSLAQIQGKVCPRMITHLAPFVEVARDKGASDLHLEPGLPPAVRIRGSLKTTGEPLDPKMLAAAAQEIIGDESWPVFLQRKSFDCSSTIQGVRCRINVLQSARGIGFAIRLLASFQATLEKLNLHPDLKRFIAPSHGLVLISGRTGSGKSSTLAALIQEINLSETRHIVTIESPIEYNLRPRMSYIRQREVGRDTPGFQQALLDALREDPDVLMVGEMREPETMQLTLNAAETGHLVLATMHSGNCMEAMQRMILAFPAEIQCNIAAQLADCLVGVVAQRLIYRPELGYRVPECEVLTSNTPVKAHIRNRDFFKIPSAIETGADHGMWTFIRYRSWLEKKTNWHNPGQGVEPPEASPEPLPIRTSPFISPGEITSKPQTAWPTPDTQTPAKVQGPEPVHRIEIEPVEGGLDEVLKAWKQTRPDDPGPNKPG
jgi:twitching motility protein PilT